MSIFCFEADRKALQTTFNIVEAMLKDDKLTMISFMITHFSDKNNREVEN